MRSTAEKSIFRNFGLFRRSIVIAPAPPPAWAVVIVIVVLIAPPALSRPIVIVVIIVFVIIVFVIIIAEFAASAAFLQRFRVSHELDQPHDVEHDSNTEKAAYKIGDERPQAEGGAKVAIARQTTAAKFLPQGARNAEDDEKHPNDVEQRNESQENHAWLHIAIARRACVKHLIRRHEKPNGVGNFHSENGGLPATRTNSPEFAPAAVKIPALLSKKQDFSE
jgi:hypothetical protein